MTATRIEIQGLTKSYTRSGKQTVAVDSVDLTIEPGEIFFLLGPSGCGKTTLLRMIAGFIEPTAGRILFDGDDVTWRPPHERRVGMVFQSYALWPHMTVAANVAFGLRVRGISAADAHTKVLAALDIVQMSEYADRKPNELSGGQQQRVALARALVVEPRVLLLDEPLSNLDTKLRNDLRSEIRKVCKQAGTTTIYVTHDQKEALAIADRIAVMKSGKVCQLGSPHELYLRPQSTFVAGFLGDLNLIPGVIVDEGAHRAVQTSFGKLGTSHESSVSVPAGSLVLAGVRPERIRLSEDGMSGQIQTATYLGDTQQIKLRAGDDEFRVVVPGGLRYREGDNCRFSVEATDVMCFPRG